MSFLNPFMLIGAIGIALPILAHLLNRHQVKRTDWAAMQFLNRNVRVRSRQLKLRDLLLLCLRCLALLALVGALAKPFVEKTKLLSGIGESRTGLVIALDGSFSMGHGKEGDTRFDRARERVATITDRLQAGDPVTLVLLGEEYRVITRSEAYDPAKFEEKMANLKPGSESLRLEGLSQTLSDLAGELDSPQKETYLITDMQARDWAERPDWFRDSLKELGESVSTTVVPVTGEIDNLAVTDLKLVSGVLRNDTVARYRATVRNLGDLPATSVEVKGLADDVVIDTKTIPLIAPGASETVSLFVHFRNAGAVRLAAKVTGDDLAADNVRQTVAVIRDEVSVLVVEGSTGGAGGFIAAALRAQSGASDQSNFAVQSVPWTDLPAQDLNRFDVVLLQNVPEITEEQAQAFQSYVRAGNGLVWFAGDSVDAAAWNQRSAVDGVSLLPALLQEPIKTSDPLGVGRPLDPTLPDHPLCRPLRSLPEDLLSETRFRQILQVKSAPGSTTVLSLAGTGAPLLLEHSVGRGQVFLFATSADSSWNNMVVTPVFPMLLQQMVTYLTAREFETARLVGDSLSLSYVDQPDASEASFDTPSGETLTVPVGEHRGQYVALLDHAEEAGFYQARVSLQAPGLPIAVNVDTAESNVRSLDAAEITRAFEDTGVAVASSEAELSDEVAQARGGRSFWFPLLIAALLFLVVETLLATFWKRGATSTSIPAEA